MKKIVILSMALFLSYAVSAGLPFVSVGVKAGIVTEKQKMDWSYPSVDMFNKATTGYHAGIVLRVDLPVIPIYFQPELLYNWSKIKSPTPPADGSSLGNVNLSNFNVPVLVGVGFGSAKMLKIRANVGPVFNLASTAKVEHLDPAHSGLTDVLKKNSVSWTAGVGIDLVGIMFDVRYNGVFKKTKVDNITASPRSWTFSLGYLF